jgi:hypothetical protein
MIDIITKPFVPEKLKLAFSFYEDGEWLRIECPGVADRYLPKRTAKALLEWIGLNSVKEKSEVIVCR